MNIVNQTLNNNLLSSPKYTVFLMDGELPATLPPLNDLYNNCLQMQYAKGVRFGVGNRNAKFSMRAETFLPSVYVWPDSQYEYKGVQYVVPKSALWSSAGQATTYNAQMMIRLTRGFGLSHRIHASEAFVGYNAGGSAIFNNLVAVGDNIVYEFGDPVELNNVYVLGCATSPVSVPNAPVSNSAVRINVQIWVNDAWVDKGALATTPGFNPIHIDATTSKVRLYWSALNSGGVSTVPFQTLFDGHFVTPKPNTPKTIGWMVLIPSYYTSNPHNESWPNTTSDILPNAYLGYQDYLGYGFTVSSDLKVAKDVFIPTGPITNAGPLANPNGWTMVSADLEFNSL